VLSLIGTVVYAAALSSIGYGLGSAWQSVSHGLTVVGYVLFAVLVIAIVGFVVYRWRQFRREARSGGAGSGRRGPGGPGSSGPGSSGPSSSGPVAGGRSPAGGSHAKPRSRKPDAGVGIVQTPRSDSSDPAVG